MVPACWAHSDTFLINKGRGSGTTAERIINKLDPLGRAYIGAQHLLDSVPQAPWQHGFSKGKSTIDAIALKNPFAASYFSQDEWNQMILKAVFMERPIYQIKDIDQRKNEKLAHILFDYARERWAASRRVTPELWRMISGYITEKLFVEMIKKMAEGNAQDQKAMLKLIQESNLDAAQQWLSSQSIEIKPISWNQIGSDFWHNNQALQNTSKA